MNPTDEEGGPPVLALVIADSAAAIAASAAYSYSVGLTVSNSAAENVELAITLPAGVSFVDASGTGWTCDEDTGVVTCTRASADVGAAPAITINVTAPATTQVVTCSGTANADDADEATDDEATQIAAAPTFFAAGNPASSTSTIQPAFPADTVAGQLAIALFECVATETVTLDNPAWVEVENSPQASPTTSLPSKLTMFWTRLEGSDVAPSTNDPGNHITGQILVFDGVVATGDPWDVTAGDAVEEPASGVVSIPGATTTRIQTLVVAACSQGRDLDSTALFNNWTNASLESITEIADICTTQGNGGGFGAACGVKATAGAYDATTTTDIGVESGQGRISLALRSY